MERQTFSATIEMKHKITERLAYFEIIPGAVDFQFQAGQYIDILSSQLDTKSGFSIVSPTTKTDVIELVIKKEENDKMTDYLFGLNEPQRINIEGPKGNFIYNPDQMQSSVLIGGGIGMTPLISMFRTAANFKSQPKCNLFQSAQYPNELIFHNKLSQLAKEYDHLAYTPTITQDENWDGHQGRFEIENILQDDDNFHYFICGPGEMNTEFREGLKEYGINDKFIHLEQY